MADILHDLRLMIYHLLRTLFDRERCLYDEVFHHGLFIEHLWKQSPVSKQDLQFHNNLTSYKLSCKANLTELWQTLRYNSKSLEKVKPNLLLLHEKKKSMCDLSGIIQCAARMEQTRCNVK